MQLREANKEKNRAKELRARREKRKVASEINATVTQLHALPAETEALLHGTNMTAAVERMAGLGLNATDIAHILGKSEAAVRRDHAEHMRVGVSKAGYRVANALFQTAADRNHRGHVTAAIYWTKARMGWAETTPVPSEGEGSNSAAPNADAAHITDDTVKARFAEAMEALRKA